jgi:hypothetical protein
MKTPASKRFLDEVGKAVHYLNTVVVGLAGVEAEICKKPDSLDVSWSPLDPRSSSRSARSYVLKSSIIFLAAELSAYVNAKTDFRDRQVLSATSGTTTTTSGTGKY